MRKYSQISVRVPNDILDMFLAKVSELAASKWRRDPAGEEAAGDLVKGMGVRYVYYVPADGHKTDIVFMYTDNELRLINIFTTGDGISHAEHGRITADLWNAGMKQACKALSLSGKFTPTQDVQPEAGLPPAVVDALQQFAVTANKSTGSSHPDDLERWCLFLGLLHATGSEMDETRLDAYLTSKKFPEKIVMKLLKEHEVAMALLPLYDRILEERKAGSVH
ncbi:MAG: hypothetical protein ACKV2U_19055 [Bryobacteraceae bacterium]